MKDHAFFLKLWQNWENIGNRIKHPRGKCHQTLLICLFGFFFLPLENCSLVWRRHYIQWRVSNFDLYSGYMTTEQWGFLRDTWDILLQWSSPRTRETHTCFQAFGSGAFTTCFNDFGFSRPEIEPRKHALPLRLKNGQICLIEALGSFPIRKRIKLVFVCNFYFELLPPNFCETVAN